MKAYFVSHLETFTFHKIPRQGLGFNILFP